MIFGKRKNILSAYEDLHTCKNCEDCPHYKLERDIMAFSAYCYHPCNWERVLMYSTLNDDPIETFACINGPDEININNNCEWRDDGLESFNYDIIDKSSEDIL